MTSSTATDQPRSMRARLEAAVQQLAVRTGSADALALAEAHFRLGVLPGTDSAEALAHLRAAVALDSLHPSITFTSAVSSTRVVIAAPQSARTGKRCA